MIDRTFAPDAASIRAARRFALQTDAKSRA
jgi:hypothetical protein